MNEAGAVAAPSPTGRILLLAGQAFALGLTLVWITIPATALFLVGVRPGAPAGDLHRGGVRRRARERVAHGRLPPPPLGRGGIQGAGRAHGAPRRCRGCCSVSPGTEWVSFALLVLVPIVVPVGFMFVVGQAGMLLDVRTLKALYARVVAGFALGVVVGGLAGPILLDALGETGGPAERGGGGRRPAASRWWSLARQAIPGGALRGRARGRRHTSDRRSARCPATAS